jgi:predicted acyltransferase
MAAELKTLSKPVAGAQVPAGKAGPAGRLMSLDVFRGMTIASMMMVNNPGTWTAVYPPLRHAEWHGWTFTDTVFPFFLWIVGVAMTLSTAKRLERGDSRASLFGHAVRRALIIFGLGLLLTLFPFFHFSTVRIPGVLQRIAICYVITMVIYLTAGIRGQIVWTGVVLTSYWILMNHVPVPGFGAGDLSKEGNFSHWVDSLFLSGHMYSATKTWDPEGIVSTLPAIATTMFGILTGHILRSQKTEAEKTSWIFVMGSVLLFAGAFLNNYMPINKPIWTVSYSLFMAGMAALTFGCCYWLVDLCGYRTWARPFAIYGMNAIAVYVLGGLFTKTLLNIKVSGADGNPVGIYGWIFERVFAPLGAPANASLAFALCYSFLFFLVAWVMYRRKWFVRI